MSPGSNTSPTTDAASTSERLAAVNNLSLDALRTEWRQLYRSPPPRLSLDLMRRANEPLRLTPRGPRSPLNYVRCWGISGPQFHATGCLLVAISGLELLL